MAEASSFTEIQSLRKCKIMAAHAGVEYSLLETSEGGDFSCVKNDCEELHLADNENNIFVYDPTETEIICGATFCIASEFFNIVFICNCTPPNIPNLNIHLIKINFDLLNVIFIF